MQQDQWVRIMFDYSSSGLWERGGSNMEGSELPISQDLQDKIEAWVRRYDRHSWELGKFDMYSSSDQRWSQEQLLEKQELEKICLEDFKESVYLAVEIKKQLPQWTVKVFNNSQGILMLPEDERHNSEILLGWEPKFLE